MAFRKKLNSIMQYNPDILILQECEHPEKINFEDFNRPIIDNIWIGDNKSKGLAIFSFYSKLQILDCYNPEYIYILPLKCDDFYILAVWAMNNKSHPSKRYIAQVWLALNEYVNILEESTLIIGDFNSNKIWDHDRPVRIANHSQVVDYLAKFNIFSIYHKYHKEDQGNESINTFYMYRNISKGYHIDYCFASNSLYNIITNFTIDEYHNWMNYSDHCPIILDLNVTKPRKSAYN